MHVGRWVWDLQAMIFEWSYMHKLIPVKSVQLLWQSSPSTRQHTEQALPKGHMDPAENRDSNHKRSKTSSRKETWRLFRKGKGREAHMVFTFNSSPKLQFSELLLHTGHVKVCLRLQLFLPCAPALVGRVSPTHRDTESSGANTSEQKQSRKTSFCSSTWKELRHLMGAVPGRCQAHSSQGISHLTSQTRGPRPFPHQGEEMRHGETSYPKPQVSTLMQDCAGGFYLGPS